MARVRILEGLDYHHAITVRLHPDDRERAIRAVFRLARKEYLDEPLRPIDFKHAAERDDAVGKVSKERIKRHMFGKERD